MLKVNPLFTVTFEGLFGSLINEFVHFMFLLLFSPAPELLLSPGFFYGQGVLNRYSEL
jgi:hypothetical protein